MLGDAVNSSVSVDKGGQCDSWILLQRS